MKTANTRLVAIVIVIVGVIVMVMVIVILVIVITITIMVMIIVKTNQDWTMMSLRFELHLLTHAFRRDVNDTARPTGLSCQDCQAGPGIGQAG